MATTTQIIDSKWFGQYKNSNDFTALPLDFTNNIVGNVFEKVKLIATVRTFTVVTIEDYYFTLDSIHMPNASLDTYLRVGDRCQIHFPGDPSWVFIFTITSVSNEIIYFNIEQNTIPNPFPINGIKDYIHVLSDLTFLKYDYGLKGSDAQQFYQSYLDDESNTFLVDNIGVRPTPLDPRPTTLSIGTKSNINSNDGIFSVKYIENNIVPIADVGLIESAQDFEITHEFTIQDYTESQIQNYQEDTKSDRYIGEVTLDYNALFEFRTVETNPDTSKLGSFLSKGNIGFIDENYNGRPNKFSFENFQIQRIANGEILSNLPSGEGATVTVTINSIEDSFINNPTIIVGHFAMISNYEFKKIPYKELFRAENIRVSGVSNPQNGDYITNAEIISATNDQLNITFDININDTDYEGLDYLIYVTVGNTDLTNVVSDRVQLKLQTGVYSDAFDVEGLATHTHQFYERGEDITGVGFTDLKTALDDIWIDKINLSVDTGAIIKKMEFQTIIYNGVGVPDVVDRQNIDLSTIDIINGVQRVENTFPSGYESLSADMEDGYFNYVNTTSTNNYELKVPFRIPSQNHIKNNNIPDVFYDPSEENNGKNLNLFKLQAHGYNAHVCLYVVFEFDGRETEYSMLSPVIEVQDYEITV